MKRQLISFALMVGAIICIAKQTSVTFADEANQQLNTEEIQVLSLDSGNKWDISCINIGDYKYTTLENLAMIANLNISYNDIDGLTISRLFNVDNSVCSWDTDYNGVNDSYISNIDVDVTNNGQLDIKRTFKEYNYKWINIAIPGVENEYEDIKKESYEYNQDEYSWILNNKPVKFNGNTYYPISELLNIFGIDTESMAGNNVIKVANTSRDIVQTKSYFDKYGNLFVDVVFLYNASNVDIENVVVEQIEFYEHGYRVVDTTEFNKIKENTNNSTIMNSELQCEFSGEGFLLKENSYYNIRVTVSYDCDNGIHKVNSHNYCIDTFED